MGCSLSWLLPLEATSSVWHRASTRRSAADSAWMSPVSRANRVTARVCECLRACVQAGSGPGGVQAHLRLLVSQAWARALPAAAVQAAAATHRAAPLALQALLQGNLQHKHL